MRLIAVCGALALFAGAAGANDQTINAANAIAQKFSEASDPSAAASTTPAAPAASASSSSGAASAPKSVAPKASETKPPSRPDIDYEMDMLKRARIEDAARKAADKPSESGKAPVTATAPATATATVAPAAPPSAAAANAIPAPPAAIAAPPASPIGKDSGTSTNTPVQAQAQAPVQPAVPAAPAPPVTPTAAPVPETPPSSPPTPPTGAAPAPGPAAAQAAAPVTGARATLLLALEEPPPGAKGSPDPIVCVGERCYVSAGLSTPAISLARTDALALKGTAETSRATCRGMYGCIYRGVPIPDGGLVSVIDVGDGQGGNTGNFTVTPDKSCRVDDGALNCGDGLVTSGYRLWVVPEATAAAAGVQVLEDAVADGLITDDDVAGGTDK